MKRFLGLTLALVLVLMMIPVAWATDAPVYEYVFASPSFEKKDTYRFDDAVTEDASATFKNGNVLTPVRSVGKHSCAFLEAGLRTNVKVSTTQTSYIKGNNYNVFIISVPESGMFDLDLNYFTHQYGTVAEIYLLEKEVNSVSKEYVAGIIDGTHSDKIIFSGKINTFEGTATKECQVSESEKFDDAESIALEKGKEYYFISMMDGPASSNNITISETTQYYYYHLESLVLTKVGEIETEPTEEDVLGSISFVATSNIGSGDMMQVSGFEYDNFIDEIPTGTSVTVTAPEKDGYEFKHWLRGSRDNGVFVSAESSYSFTALTNTFLTAVYEKKSDESDNSAVVEFYNGNGQYLKKTEANLGETVALPEIEPELTGFEFADEWKSEDGIFTSETPLARKLTRAVAQFVVIDETFDVTDKRDESVHKLSYGEEKTLTSDKAVYWVRDNTIVDYGKAYTYAAWDDTEISTSESGELLPVVLLDSDAKNGARMIEYNAAGKNIIEVGIVFGSVNNVTIESCDSKATSQYKNQHGQFTAKPNGSEAYARGYLIYEEDGTYKVVYSK